MKKETEGQNDPSFKKSVLTCALFASKRSRILQTMLNMEQGEGGQRPQTCPFALNADCVL